MVNPSRRTLGARELAKMDALVNDKRSAYNVDTGKGHEMEVPSSVVLNSKLYCSGQSSTRAICNLPALHYAGAFI